MRKIVVIGLWFLIAVSASWSSDVFQICDGDRVVIWGDSITDDAFYPRSIENYVLSHYPDWTVEFHNLGWGGDSTFTLERMKRDLVPCNPTLVTIKLGMNDGSYNKFSQEVYDRYINQYRKLLDFLRANTSARIVLISTVTYETDVVPTRDFGDEKGRDMSTYPETLRRMSAGVRDLANEYQAGYIDLNDLYEKTLKEGKANNPKFVLSGDAIHPNVNGQAYMAYYILKGLHASGAISEIAIDAKNGEIVSEQGSYIQNLGVKENQISFTRQDRSLPFHFSGEASWEESVTQKETWYNDLNRDWLVVKNLQQPYALLSIDGEAIAVFSREQWEQGINLSLLPKSAMLKQGALIAEMTEKRHAAEYTRWRRILLEGVGSPYDFTPYKPETVYSLYQKENVDFTHRMQLKYNDPVPRAFLLTCGEKDELEKALSK